jgi:hypothetical protein
VIGYYVRPDPRLASFRLRVAIPSKYVGPHRFGLGDITFFYKNGDPQLASRLIPTVYDVVNPHFNNPDYMAMLEIATVVTCPSKAMAGLILQHGRTAAVIPDPYENEESPVAVSGFRVLWFGHQANIKSLEPYKGLDIRVCTADQWSLENEAEALKQAGVVLLTASNPGASSNRPVKAIRAGRFVVAPEDCPESWRELSDFMWIGDVREGIRWAFSNREEACHKVLQGQKYVSRFSPQLIGSQWADLFASTLGADINTNPAGSALTSPLTGKKLTLRRVE